MERDDSPGLTDGPPGRLEHAPGPEHFDAGEGRRFGLTLGGAFLALAAFLAWRGHTTLAATAAAVGGLLALAGLVAPGRTGPLWRGWMALARAISKVTTPVVMALLYYLLITPTALLRRTLGSDPLEPEDDGESYWVARSDGGARTDLHRPF